MQPKLSVRSSDWACWLDSIALQPHQHGTLVQIGNEVLVLSPKQMQQQRRTAQKLTSKKIIEITQEMWNDPTVNQTEKGQMLKGLCYIYEQRSRRYQNLFWLVRVIAKWTGIRALLQDEMQKIGSLSVQHLAGIRANMDRLAREPTRQTTQKEERSREWYDAFFQLERNLYQFKRHLPTSLLPEFKPRLKELDQAVDRWNQNIPRFRDVVKVFGVESIKSNLEETLISLCDEEVANTELWHDQRIFQCSQLEAYGRYTKRLIKAQRTDLSVSLISAIEREWKNIINTKQKNQGGITKVLEGHRVIFIPKDGEIYLKEGFISAGSFKAAFLASPFHALKTNKDRYKLAILQPLKAVLDEVSEGDDEVHENPVTSHKSKTPIDDQEAENFEKEAQGCLRYGKLPGIWPTHKVATVDGQIAIIQSAAGYSVTTALREEESLINFKDMISLFNLDMLKKEDQLVLLRMIKHFLVGVNSFHTHGIMHRDLKPENVLCSDEGTAGVSDLGTICSNVIDNGDGRGSQPNPEKENPVGSPLFIAPESWAYVEAKKWEEIDLKADIWATGLILWELLASGNVIDHPAIQSVGDISKLSAHQIVFGVAKLLSDPKKAKMYATDYKEPKEETSLAHLVWRCTRPNPADRPLIAEVIAHYDRWATYTEARMKKRAIRSIRDTFNHKVK